VYKWPINPISNPYPVYSHTPKIVTFWCQKWSDWKLHWILIFILLYYENGTNDGTDAGKDEFLSRRNEVQPSEMKAMQQKMDANQKERKEYMKTNQAKTDANLKEIRAGQELLKEERKAKIYSHNEKLMVIMKAGKEKIEA
jgi:hypothetical protein